MAYLHENYSDKSFLVLGDTKPLASTLKQLGGRFNYFKVNGIDPVPGWVFSNSHLERIKTFLERGVILPSFPWSSLEKLEEKCNSEELVMEFKDDLVLIAGPSKMVEQKLISFNPRQIRIKMETTRGCLVIAQK